MTIEERLLGDKRIKLRDTSDNIWVRIEHVVMDVNGTVLYIIDQHDIVYPWHAIDMIAPLGR